MDDASSSTNPEQSVPPQQTTPLTTTKADTGKRIIAGIIDVAIAAVIGLIPVIGGLIGAAYMLLRDGLDYDYLQGRSVGKTLMKLRPVRLEGGTMDINTSIRRNWTLVFGSLTQVLLFIPIIGWLLIPFVGLAAVVIGIAEIVLVLTDPEGRRWGDKLANTKVIEVNE